MDQDNKRREPRESVFLKAKLRNTMAEISVTVRNLSSHGAMIEGTGQIRVGSEVALQLNAIGRVYGTVAWAKFDSCGLQFSRPIDHRAARRHINVQHFGRASLFVEPPKRTVS